MNYYPLQMQPSTTMTWTYGQLSAHDLDRIRALVKEEVHNALHPEEQRESATVEYTQDGKTWRGKVYLVEKDEETA